ncbi:hypothetical protein WA026_023270 [Henosepilachna vigintioctopunctata]|uniref:Reverse transcriptase domain-containing protein n=1 Tax=Henosepilachna vigintioctopunctata TaxID=420089 RepID=A0AAW1V2G1_9CUCU
MTIFADDTSVAITAGSPEKLLDKCSMILGEFKKWCQYNALILNTSKTKCLIFNSSYNVDNGMFIQFESEKLFLCDHVKFLGILLDRDLRWSLHVDSVTKKLSSAFYAINKIKNFLSTISVMEVYYALAYSHINYNIMLWGSSVDSQRVFISQKRLIRTIFRLGPRESCKGAFIGNKILTTPCIFIYRCLIYVKENEGKFVKLSSFHCHNTRNVKTLFIPGHSSAKYENSPAYQCIKLYNHLPYAFKCLGPARFRKIVKSVLLKNCYYSVREYLTDNNITYV